MIGAETIELIRASGGDVAFRIDRSLDRQRPRVGRCRRGHPLRELDLELIAHAGGGRRILQKEVHHQELADFDKVVLLLVGAGDGPCARVGGEIPCQKRGAFPCKLLLNPSQSTARVKSREVEGPHRPFRDGARFLPYPRKVWRREIKRNIRPSHTGSSPSRPTPLWGDSRTRRRASHA